MASAPAAPTAASFSPLPETVTTCVRQRLALRLVPLFRGLSPIALRRRSFAFSGAVAQQPTQGLVRPDPGFGAAEHRSQSPKNKHRQRCVFSTSLDALLNARSATCQHRAEVGRHRPALADFLSNSFELVSKPADIGGSQAKRAQTFLGHVRPKSANLARNRRVVNRVRPVFGQIRAISTKFGLGSTECRLTSATLDPIGQSTDKQWSGIDQDGLGLARIGPNSTTHSNIPTKLGPPAEARRCFF